MAMRAEGTEASEPVRSAGGRRRNAERSRHQILDAAEQLFAERGYDGASLAQIGKEAGTSAALPAYFFGDKAELYRAVVMRLLADRDAVLGPLCDQALEVLGSGDGGLREGLHVLVSGYLSFLQARPTFVQMMARDALDRERLGHMDLPRHSSVFQKGVCEFISAIDTDQGPAFDGDQLMVSIVALCFFPLEHDSTMLASMGYRARTEGYISRRADHVVDLLMHALSPGLPTSA
jgi:TetR/AcrR family transcriptional regulator